MRFMGSLRVLKKATYTLSIASDDGSRLYLNDALIIDNDGKHPARKKEDQKETKTGYISHPPRLLQCGGECDS